MARRQKNRRSLLGKLRTRLTSVSPRILPVLVMVSAGVFIYVSVSHIKIAASTDPYFKVKGIAVHPPGVLTSAEQSYLKAVTHDKSLLDLDLKTISGMLEKNPFVYRAEVVRQLPNELHIRLAVRQPVLQIQTHAGGPFHLVSKDGMVLGTSTSRWPQLMIVEDYGSADRNYSAGKLYSNMFFDEWRALINFIRVSKGLGHEEVSRVSTDHLGNLTLILSDGVEIKMGRKLALDDTTEMAVNGLLKSPERPNLLYLDVRYNNIIVKKR